MILFVFLASLHVLTLSGGKESPRRGAAKVWEEKVPLSESLCVFVFSFSIDILEQQLCKLRRGYPLVEERLISKS